MCLSDSSACPQYECVGRPGVCDRSGELACDTEGVVHPSVCDLQQAGKRLAYMGNCQVATHTLLSDPDLRSHRWVLAAGLLQWTC